MLEFGEFCQLAARFLVEEDEEALKKELKEAFRIYDKEGKFKHMYNCSRYLTLEKQNNRLKAGFALSGSLLSSSK